MRKTSKDYTKELESLRSQQRALESRIKDRLVKMVEQHPDAIIKESGEDKFKAKCVTRSYIEQLDTDTMVKFIRTIEEQNAKAEPYVQLTIV